MRSFASVDRTAMRWIRPAPDRSEYELRAGDALLARLAWAKTVGSLAHADLSEGAWTFKRGGFLQPHVTVRDAAGHDLARLAMHLTQGTVTTASGSSFRFRRAGLLVPAWQFSDAAGRQIVHIEPVAERSRLQGGLVQVDATFESDPALPLLVMLGWYFIVLAWFEDEALRASESFLSAASG